MAGIEKLDCNLKTIGQMFQVFPVNPGEIAKIWLQVILL